MMGVLSQLFVIVFTYYAQNYLDYSSRYGSGQDRDIFETLLKTIMIFVAVSFVMSWAGITFSKKKAKPIIGLVLCLLAPITFVVMLILTGARFGC